jgi:hypothetical protein
MTTTDNIDGNEGRNPNVDLSDMFIYEPRAVSDASLFRTLKAIGKPPDFINDLELRKKYVKYLASKTED